MKQHRPCCSEVPLPCFRHRRVGNSLIGFSSESLIFYKQKIDSLVKKSNRSWSLFSKEWLERFTHSCSFIKSDGSNPLPSGYKKQEMQWKTVKNVKKTWFFFNKSLSFESNLLESQANHWHPSFLKKSRAICSQSLFSKERWEPFPHSHSFTKWWEWFAPGRSFL